MCKQEFLEQLRKGLSGLPQDEIEERLTFYSEMIEDRKEEGLSEEEAVASVGDAAEITGQILADSPVQPVARKNRRLKTWEIVLLVLGSPVWLSLLIAVAAVVFSLYVSLWAVILSLWAVFAAVTVFSVGIAALGIGFALNGNVPAGMVMIGEGFICAGVAIFLFFGCKAATKATLWLTKKLISKRGQHNA